MARPSTTDPGGKLVIRFEMTVSEELDESISALAVIAGSTKAELARHLLERQIFGDLSMLRRVAGRNPLSQPGKLPGKLPGRLPGRLPGDAD